MDIQGSSRMKFSTRIVHGFRNPVETARFFYYKLLRLFGYKGLLKVQLKQAKSSLYVDSLDNGISRDLFIWRRREEEATAIFKTVLKPGQTIVDLGANIGYYVVIEAEHIGPTGRILAIEPSPSNIELLKKNVTLNGYNDIVHVEHAAIADVSGTATLHLSKKSNMNTLLRTPFMDSYTSFSGTIEVPTYTLDDYLTKLNVSLESVDIIRMDIEGFETKAFAGMERTIAASNSLIVFVELHPNLICENSGPDAYGAFIEQLDRYGFRVIGAAMSASSRLDSRIEIGDMKELAKIEKPIEVILAKNGAAI